MTVGSHPRCGFWGVAADRTTEDPRITDAAYSTCPVQRRVRIRSEVDAADTAGKVAHLLMSSCMIPRPRCGFWGVAADRTTEDPRIIDAAYSTCPAQRRVRIRSEVDAADTAGKVAHLLMSSCMIPRPRCGFWAVAADRTTEDPRIIDA